MIRLYNTTARARRSFPKDQRLTFSRLSSLSKCSFDNLRPTDLDLTIGEPVRDDLGRLQPSLLIPLIPTRIASFMVADASRRCQFIYRIADTFRRESCEPITAAEVYRPHDALQEHQNYHPKGSLKTAHFSKGTAFELTKRIKVSNNYSAPSYFRHAHHLASYIHCISRTFSFLHLSIRVSNNH